MCMMGNPPPPEVEGGRCNGYGDVPEELMDAMRRVLNGERTPMPPRIRKVVEGLLSGEIPRYEVPPPLPTANKTGRSIIDAIQTGYKKLRRSR